jgi:hypothetical protein
VSTSSNRISAPPLNQPMSTVRQAIRASLASPAAAGVKRPVEVLQCVIHLVRPGTLSYKMWCIGDNIYNLSARVQRNSSNGWLGVVEGASLSVIYRSREARMLNE